MLAFGAGDPGSNPGRATEHLALFSLRSVEKAGYALDQLAMGQNLSAANRLRVTTLSTLSPALKCGEVRTFLSRISGREESSSPLSIPPTDLDYLTANSIVSRMSNEDHEKAALDVARLTQLVSQVGAEREKEEAEDATMRQDEQKEHSFTFHLEGEAEKEQLRENVQREEAAVSQEEAELKAMEANVNTLIQEKSAFDRMVAYDDGYLSLTGLGTIVLSDLIVMDYRVADQEFSGVLAEIKSTNEELRSIADRAASYVASLKPLAPDLEKEERQEGAAEPQPPAVWAPSSLWSAAIGLAKLTGDPEQIHARFVQALTALKDLKATTPNKLMAAEVMTALGQDVSGMEATLKDLDGQLRSQGVPNELSAGVAATLMAGKRFDGTYPTDRFSQFKDATPSFEAASILAVSNLPVDGLTSRFHGFGLLFTEWGYMESEDTEISSAFLAIGELNPVEVQERLKYIIEQLKNYLEYPLVAAAILASIPVFESHEVLDLMERAVAILSGYAAGLERSELVALAVRMIHGVRNEVVRKVDPTAKIAETPVQFNYSTAPGLFMWHYPLIIAYSSYHSTFSAMGGFHPAHSHGIGGFVG